MNAAEVKFLIVDDSLVMRHILHKMLTVLGYTSIQEAEDGVMALNMLNYDHAFSVVITDVTMPNMDGWELLEAIKATPTLQHLPVLMATGEAREEDIDRAMQAGAAGYLVKPFVKADLEARIQEIIQGLSAHT